MGIYFSGYAVSDDTIERLLSDPPLVMHVIAPGDDESFKTLRDEYYAEPPQPPKRSWLARIFLGQKTSQTLDPAPAPAYEPLQLAPGEGSEFTVDKAWHALHEFLETETDHPHLDFIMMGGEPVGTFDVGMGPARYLKAETVTQIHAGLETLDEDWLRQKWDPKHLKTAQVYPPIWDDAGDDEFSYLRAHFSTLKSAIANMAENNFGMIMVVG